MKKRKEILGERFIEAFVVLQRRKEILTKMKRAHHFVSLPESKEYSNHSVTIGRLNNIFQVRKIVSRFPIRLEGGDGILWIPLTTWVEAYSLDSIKESSLSLLCLFSIFYNGLQIPRIEWNHCVKDSLRVEVLSL